MSVAEIKQAIDKLTPAERAEVSRHLRGEHGADTPERRAELSRIRDEMEAGDVVSLTELKRRHAQRVARGE